MIQQIEKSRSGSMHSTIYMPNVRRFAIPVPPLDQQDHVVRLVRRYLERIRLMRAAVEQQPAELREYREPLISEAVTDNFNIFVSEEEVA